MKNLTTPQAILCGFALVALAIASIPYSSNIVTPAQVVGKKVQKIAICNENGIGCAHIRAGKHNLGPAGLVIDRYSVER